MGIFETAKEKHKSELVNKTVVGAREYLYRLELALSILREFDSKMVDDIIDVKSSLEKTGTACIMTSSKDGYQFLMDSNGRLLASHILDEKSLQEK